MNSALALTIPEISTFKMFDMDQRSKWWSSISAAAPEIEIHDFLSLRPNCHRLQDVRKANKIPDVYS